MQADAEEIVEIVEIETCVRERRQVPYARRYKYRDNKQDFISDKPEISREDILERARVL